MQRQAQTTRGRRTRAQRRSFPRGRATTLKASTGRSTSSRSRASSKRSARGGSTQRPRARVAGKNTSRRPGGSRMANRRGAKRSRGLATRGRTGTRTRRSQSSAQTTTDHDTIQQWAEERGGVPATVTRTAGGGGAGVLRIDFPGFSGKGTLNEISWDQWFRKFDQNNLAFLYQDETAGGDSSRFFKLVKRSSAKTRR